MLAGQDRAHSLCRHPPLVVVGAQPAHEVWRKIRDLQHVLGLGQLQPFVLLVICRRNWASILHSLRKRSRCRRRL